MSAEWKEQEFCLEHTLFGIISDMEEVLLTFWSLGRDQDRTSSSCSTLSINVFVE
jgi:hypothetical protein